MIIDVKSAPVPDVYRVLTSIVVPRPIAWVTTLDAEGRVNLAPFSFFNVFGANPPIVVFSPTTRRDGTHKDTLLNVQICGEFVVNAVNADLADVMNETSRELPRGESEAAANSLSLIPSVTVKPPRIAASPMHLECRVRQILPFGDGPIAPNLVIGEVVLIHVDDAALDPDGNIDTHRYFPPGRMGGEEYCRTHDRFVMKRP